MQIVRTVAEARAARASVEMIGFVPTMGFLHEGHLTLARRAKAECGRAIMSIFVNPTQFGPGEDLDRYPRALERDLDLLRAEEVDFAFVPEVVDLYPQGFATKIDVGPIAQRLEGAVRPGHFSGVAVVVAKLLNIVQPTRAYFGQKDAQQTVVIHRLVADLDLPVQVVIAPTVRETDGLALSSRNAYLSPDDRASAPVLFRALSAAQASYEAGERGGDQLRAAMRQVLVREPRAQADYVSIAHPRTLDELATVGPEGALASLAARFGATRLIDNVVLRP